MNEEIKLCPWCGGKGHGYTSKLTGRWIYCANEDCWFHHRSTTPDRWNTRPIEDALQAKVEKLEAALHKIAGWADAYPLDVFPEPNWPRVDYLLMRGGQRLDRVSAANMRHVVEGVGQIAQDALKESEE